MKILETMLLIITIASIYVITDAMLPYLEEETLRAEEEAIFWQDTALMCPLHEAALQHKRKML